MDLKIDNDAIEEIVQSRIALAVTEALAKDAPVLIDRLVREALSKKEERRYGPQPARTIIEKLAHEKIVEAAKDAAGEWLEEVKPRVKELVAEKLASKTDGLIASIADQMVASLQSELAIDVRFKCGDGDKEDY